MLRTYVSKEKILLICLVVLLLLFAGILSLYKKTIFNRQQRNQVVTKKLIYKNPELGISFEYPASWGTANTLATGTVFSSLIKISFPSKPNVILYSTFNHMSYANYEEYSNSHNYAWDFDEDSYMYSSEKLTDFCSKKVQDPDGPLIQSIMEKHLEGIDVFRLEGVYIYGDCTDSSGHLRIGFKNGDIRIRSSFDKNYSGKILKPLSLYNYYYWALNTPSHRGLNLKVTELGFDSYQYCLSGTTQNNVARVDRCINYADKSNIENAFQSIDSSAENAEILDLVNNLKTWKVDSNSYTRAFTDLSDFANPAFHIKFRYPSALHAITLTPPTEILVTSADDPWPGSAGYVSISKTTKEQAQSDTQAYGKAMSTDMEGEGPIPPLVGTAQFIEDKKILENNSPGSTVQCPKTTDSMLSYDPILCEITTLGSAPAIKRYYYPSPWDRGVAVEYTLYIGEDRIDIESTARGVDIKDYNRKQKENTEVNFRISNQILQSISFK